MSRTKDTFLYTKKHALLCGHVEIEDCLKQELAFIKKNFCGNVFLSLKEFNRKQNQFPKNTILYVCGKNIQEMLSRIDLGHIAKVLIIKEFSKHLQQYELVSLGEIPINIHNVGVFFRSFFDSNSQNELYNRITQEHQFQSLTLSNKPGSAYRKGIYLTNVEKDGDEIKFKLLRCSTNLDGPTDNFRTTDNQIIQKVDKIRQYFFKDGAELNHVLAQTYINGYDANMKERKAKIAVHSDKTKDMPTNGLIAFCTFYTFESMCESMCESTCKNNCESMCESMCKNNCESMRMKNVKKDSFDYYYKNKTSVLTKLRFRLKNTQTLENGFELTPRFDITLYPNSVFLMPLSTNRLYTHEIVPSSLPIDKIPTRMGYVIRCSNTDAVFRDGQTHIVKNDKHIKLTEPTPEGIKELKKLYFIENTTTERVDYEHFYFSMNNGDYLQPNL